VTYEPYLPWSCDRCGRRGQAPVPAETDPQELQYRALEAHDIATDGSCPGFPRTGQLVLPDLTHPLRYGPSEQFSLL
jgi:hypothetical protein